MVLRQSKILNAHVVTICFEAKDLVDTCDEMLIGQSGGKDVEHMLDCRATNGKELLALEKLACLHSTE